MVARNMYAFGSSSRIYCLRHSFPLLHSLRSVDDSCSPELRRIQPTVQALNMLEQTRNFDQLAQKAGAGFRGVTP